ncbi:MAG: hypothetical protein HEQ38_19195 [Gemmatimonas sp.]|nr:hypothetical protein [Gemmatimonas sp.]
MAKTYKVPKLVNGRGTLPIDRQFGTVGNIEVGRMRVASGTTDPTTWQTYMTMLDSLVELDRGDILISLNKKEKTFPDVLKLWKSHKLNSIIKVVTGHGDALTAMNAWIDEGLQLNGEPYTAKGIKAHKNNINQLFKVATGAESVKDLPTLLR